MPYLWFIRGLALLCCTVAISGFYLFLQVIGQDINEIVFIKVTIFGYLVTVAGIFLSEGIWKIRH